MKFRLLLSAVLAMATLSLSAGTLPGCDFLMNDEYSTGDARYGYVSHRQDAVYNTLGMPVLPLYHLDDRGGAVVYHNGLVVYPGFVGGGKSRYGAIDMFGNVVVPFRYRSPRDAAASKEAKAFVMTDRMKQFIAELQQTEQTRRMATALAEYRKARYTDRRDRCDRMLASVRDGDKAAVIDCFGNYLIEEKTDFEFMTRYKHSEYEARVFDYTHRDWSQPIMFVLKNSFGESNYNLAGKRSNRVDQVAGPTFVEFLTNYVNLNMTKWYEKEEFESVEEYQTRNSAENICRAQEYFADCAHVVYSTLVGRDFKLKSYDRANSSYLLSSPAGNVPISVPFDESLELRAQWEKGNAKVPYVHFTSRDGGITLASAKIQTPTEQAVAEMYHGGQSIGYQSYTIENLAEAPVIDVVRSTMPIQSEAIRGRAGAADPLSDVDTDLPLAGRTNANTFALVIANEDYAHLTRVPYAAKDGRMFGEYCTKVLGMPDGNVRLHSNASYATMISAVDDIRRICDAYNGDIDLLVYYAGHGAPDEQNRGAHLLPVDTRGVDSRTCISLEQFYRDLSNLDARSVTVFLDACFTGHARGRDGDMLAMGERAFLEVEPRTEQLPSNGKLIVFSAAGKQSAIPDDDKGHGLFTYYLLKKLKDSAGRVSYGELWQYLSDNVARRSAVIGKNKIQTPELEISDNARSSWSTMRFIP